MAAAKLRTVDDERRQAKRNSPADKLTVEAKALAELKVEKAAVEGERRTVEADLGPVRYLATLIGADNETVLRWFILVVALLLDPAAVLLLLAATRTRAQAPRQRAGRAIERAKPVGCQIAVRPETRMDEATRTASLRYN